MQRSYSAHGRTGHPTFNLVSNETRLFRPRAHGSPGSTSGHLSRGGIPPTGARVTRFRSRTLLLHWNSHHSRLPAATAPPTLGHLSRGGRCRTTPGFRWPLLPPSWVRSSPANSARTTPAFRRPLRQRDPQPTLTQYLASGFASAGQNTPPGTGLNGWALADQSRHQPHRPATASAWRPYSEPGTPPA
jgi:hypothetical protein